MWFRFLVVTVSEEKQVDLNLLNVSVLLSELPCQMPHCHSGEGLPSWTSCAQKETATCLSYSPGRNDRDPGSELIRMVTNQPVNTREQGLVTWGDGTFLKNVIQDKPVSTCTGSSEP